MLPSALGFNSKSLTKKEDEALKDNINFRMWNKDSQLTPKYRRELKTNSGTLLKGGVSLRNVNKVARLTNRKKK